MRLLHYCIILLFVALSANGQQDTQLNEQLRAIQKITTDTVRIDSLCHTGFQNLYDRPHAVLVMGKNALKDAQEHNYKNGIANASRLVAESYELISDYSQSIKYYLDALHTQQELGMFGAQLRTLLGISRCYDQLNDLDGQKKFVLDALKLCEEHKNDDRIKQKRPEVLDYLATLYKKEGKYDSSIKLYAEAIDQAKKYNDNSGVMSSMCNMAIALKSNKNYTASLSAYWCALRMADSLHDDYAVAVISDNMAILFYEQGDMDRSEQYALYAIRSLKNVHVFGVLKDAYETLKNIYIKEKRYPEAIEYFSRLSNIKDSLYSNERLKLVKEMQAKYDLDSKDKQIAAQDSKIRENRRANVFMALISMLVLIICILFILNQRKKKHLDEQRNLQMKRLLDVKERDNEIYRLRNVELKASHDEILLRKEQAEEEKKKSEALLLNILPAETAYELISKGYASSHKYDMVTVMFVDFVGFTHVAERFTAEELVERIDHYFGAFDNIILNHGLEKIKTIGDAYMCAGGLPVVNTTNPVDVLNAAFDIMDFVKSSESRNFFNVRIGLHCGPLVAGVVGTHKFQYDIWGDTVNIAARTEESSEPGRINISGVMYEYVKHRFACEHRGKIKSKNKGEMDMYFVNSKL